MTTNMPFQFIVNYHISHKVNKHLIACVRFTRKMMKHIDEAFAVIHHFTEKKDRPSTDANTG